MVSVLVTAAAVVAAGWHSALAMERDVPPVVACYYASWAHYRKGMAQYRVEDVPVELCTHIIYAFAVLDANTLVAKQHDSWLDRDLKNYDKFVKLKKRNPNVKVLLGLGGWNDSRSNKYSRLVADPGSRRHFVEEVVKLLLHHGFDGLDLDWEYPGYEGNVTDKKGFTSWLEDLREAFTPHNLLLTSAVSAARHTIDRGYDVPRVAKLLDLLFLMSYDFHGSWESQVAHHSPLKSEPGQNPEFCTDFAVNYWIKKGAPAHKMVVGVPLYGRSWTLAGDHNFPGSAARGAGRGGPHVKASGNMAFFECCLAHQKEGWTKITGVGGPYITKGDQWVGYDDVDAVTKKAEYALANGLGGVMVWDTATDDFGDYCGLGPNPLLTAIATTLNGDGPATTAPDNTEETPPTPPASTNPPKRSSITPAPSRPWQAPPKPPGPTSDSQAPYGDPCQDSENKVDGDQNKLPYAWLAWPIFSQSTSSGQKGSSGRKPCSSQRGSTSTSPSSSSSPPWTPAATASSSPFTTKRPWYTTSTSSTPLSSSLWAPSSPSSAAAWYADCRASGFAFDPVSCSNFYRCTAAYAYQFNCPGGLVWNQDESSCDWPDKVQCVLPLRPPDLRAFLAPKDTGP